MVFLISEEDGKVNALVAVTKDLTKRFNAAELIKRVAPIIGGRGGGKEDLAQAEGLITGKTKRPCKKQLRQSKKMSSKE